MERIKTAKMREKKDRKNNIILGGVLIALLVIAPLGYSLMSGEGSDNSKVKERGYEFYKTNLGWTTVIDGQQFGFRYLPSEVSEVSVEGIHDLGSYVNQPIYFVNFNDAALEILNNIQGYILRYQEACLEEEGCKEGLPVKDCSGNMIVYEEGDDTKVYKNESCVYLVGDAVMAADAFLYSILHI